MRFKKPKIVQDDTFMMISLDNLNNKQNEEKKQTNEDTKEEKEKTNKTKDSLINTFRDPKTLDAFNYYFQEKLEQEDTALANKARASRKQITEKLAQRRKTWRKERQEPGDIGDEVEKEEDQEKTSDENDDAAVINMSKKEKRLPKWMTTSVKQNDQLSIQLHDELLQFYDFLKETKRERRIRHAVCAQIRSILSRHFSELDVYVFGSFSSKIMLPQSDIDFQCYARYPSNVTSSQRITRIKHVLERANVGRDFKCILSARVPVLKFVHIPTFQSIDISISRDATQLENTLKSVEFISEFRKKFPSFVILTTILKLFLKQRGLNEVFTGGVSSYGLSLMVISFLQQHPGAHNVTSQKKISLGNLLMDFFALYGRHFNYESVAISVLDDGLYIRKDSLIHVSNKYWYPDLCRIAVMDPTDESNIVTYPSTDVLKIRKAFYAAFLQLLQPTDDFLLTRLFSESDPTIQYRDGALLDMPLDDHDDDVVVDIDNDDDDDDSSRVRKHRSNDSLSPSSSLKRPRLS